VLPAIVPPSSGWASLPIQHRTIKELLLGPPKGFHYYFPIPLKGIGRLPGNWGILGLNPGY